MAKNIYIGVDNVARKVKQPYIGIDNIARKVKSGFIGVDNVARQFFAGYVWKKYNVSQQWNYKMTYTDTDRPKKADYYRLHFPENPQLYTSSTVLEAYQWYRSRYDVSFTIDQSTGYFVPQNYVNKTGVAPQKIGSSSVTTGALYELGFRNATYVTMAIMNRHNLGDVATFKSDWRDDDDDIWRSIQVNSGNYGALMMREVPGDIYHIQVFQAYSEAVQGAYVGDVTSSDPNAYPTNGIHSDGYWYVKQ